MRCSKCGKEIPDGSAFCQACGTAAAPPPADAAPGQSTPPPVSPVTPPPAAAPSGGGGSTKLIIGCVALVLVVLVGVGGFFGARWWRTRNAVPPAPITQSGGLDIAEPEGGQTTPTTGPDTDEPEPIEGGVHTEDVDKARQLVMDFFAMWSEGDYEGIKDISTPAMLVGTDDWDFESAYEQIGVKILKDEKTEEDRWLFTVEETYESAEDGRTETEYEVEVWKRYDGFAVCHVGKPGDGFYDDILGGSTDDDDGDDDNSGHYSRFQPTQNDKDHHYAAALLTAYIFFLGWKEGDADKVREQMSEELAEETDFDVFDTGYKQVGMVVEDAELLDEDGWEFTIRETFRPLDAESSSVPLISRYKLVIEYFGQGNGYLMSDWDILDDD